MIAISLTGPLTPAHRKRVEGEMRDLLAKPPGILIDDDENVLKAKFDFSAGRFLSVELRNPSQTVATIEPVLKTGHEKIAFLCADEKTYLRACSELSLSKRDLFRFAQLKRFLPSDEAHSDTIIGSAHKLIRALNSGKIKSPAFANVNRSGLKRTADTIFDAEKFLVTDNKWNPATDKFKYYPGDYRLPFDRCLFEYSFAGKDPVTKLIRPMTTYVMAFDYGGIYHAFLYDYQHDTQNFMNLGFGPSWSINPDGTLDKQNICMLSDSVSEYYDLHYGEKFLDTRSYSALRRIAPTLAAINDPSSRMTTHVMNAAQGRGKQNETQGRIPFFRYMEVNVEDLHDDQGKVIRGNAVMGREGVALHKVRGYVKPSLDNRWVEPYIRGDARHGVVVRSFKSDGGENGPK